MTPALSTAADVLLSLYPEPLRTKVEGALPALWLEAARLGLEVIKAERAGLKYAEAATRPRDYPLMQRIHFGFIDVLQHEMPATMADSLREFCRRARDFDDHELSKLLFAAAAPVDSTAERAVLRFLIYEVIRVTAWVLSYEDPSPEALRCHQALEIDAEARMRKHFYGPPMFEEDVRPLQVLLAEAMEYLCKQQQHRLATARAQGAATIEIIDRLMKQVLAARSLAAPEAALVRNQYARDLGDEELGAHELAERHPDIFPSAEAVWQRNSRFTKLLESGTFRIPRARLIDLLRESLEVTK